MISFPKIWSFGWKRSFESGEREPLLKLVVVMDNWLLMDLVRPLDLVSDMRIHGDDVVTLLGEDDREVTAQKDLLDGF